MAHCSLLAPHTWHTSAASDVCAPQAWQALVSSCGLTPLSSDVASTHARTCTNPSESAFTQGLPCEQYMPIQSEHAGIIQNADAQGVCIGAGCLGQHTCAAA